MATVTPIEMVNVHTEDTEYDADGRAASFSTADNRTVRARVTDAEVMTRTRWRGPSQKWTPEHLRIDYRRSNNDEWSTGSPSLSGHMLRKDGSVGQRRVSVVYSPWDDEKPPAWVTAFVETAHPDAVVKPTT